MLTGRNFSPRYDIGERGCVEGCAEPLEKLLIKLWMAGDKWWIKGLFRARLRVKTHQLAVDESISRVITY